MSENKKTAYVTRDSIQKLLSHDELAKVSGAESAPRLARWQVETLSHVIFIGERSR